jgi:nucleoside-diphosphate-sugar epimerase
MNVFITGGSGFIGKRVVARLVARGDEVYALARSDRSAALITSLGARPVRGDLFHVGAMRRVMQDCDVVIHLAAWYELGVEDTARMEAVNVQGTRNVLETAWAAEVPKIVYASTVAVFGDTHGELVDESFYREGPFLTPYDRTKWEAHYEVALPLIEQGAPIVIVMPGGVYGPGDHSMIGELMGMFYQGHLPVLPGPETTLTFAHVDDIADGILRAADRGREGESYVLAGPALTLKELIVLWRELTGKSGPLFAVPARWVRPLAPVIDTVASVLPLPSIFNRDALAILGTTYIARSGKARAELGWSTRSLYDGMLETLMALARSMPAQPAPVRRRRFALKGVGVAVGLLALWLFLHRKKRA